MRVNISQKMRRDLVKRFADEENLMGYGFLTGKAGGNMVVIQDVIIPEQRRTKAMVKVSGDEVYRMVMLAILKNETIVGSVIYNGSAPCFESSLDRKDRESLSRKLLRPTVSVIVNSKDECKVYQ